MACITILIFHAKAEFIIQSTEDILWFICQIATQRSSLTNGERISILEQARTIADAVFPDFDYGNCYSIVTDINLLLFRFYTEKGQTHNALWALQKTFQNAKALDACANDIVQYTSSLLRGHEFDMKKVWDGSKYNSVFRIFAKLQEPPFRFDRYKEDELYQSILKEYQAYAIEDKS